MAERIKTWHILVIDDDDGRRAIALDAATYSLGRDPANLIVLNSTSVSRQHAILLRVPKPDGEYIYRLLDGNLEGRRSMNGITVNSQKTLAHDLRDGDMVLFGGKVQVQYCLRQLSADEFVRYLQSINYRSIKAEVSDARTTVARQLDEFYKTTKTAIKADPKQPTTPLDSAQFRHSLDVTEKSKGWWQRLPWVGQRHSD
ncbi:MAG: FHA domain-containing protein [Synechococcaceae cyanobacterium SM2_3_1]|nr:FHA domain-containing protein [Synechococcaceae cyanobacterium SM2_3_1]